MTYEQRLQNCANRYNWVLNNEHAKCAYKDEFLMLKLQPTVGESKALERSDRAILSK